jgi:toxin ParE1/3/4
MLPVVWAKEADDDLAEITDYIGQINPTAAIRLWQLIVESTTYLSEHPYLFKLSERVPGCREIVVHPNYVVFYCVKIDCIQVLRVVHSRQKYPL